jgi:hypothetical protein
MPTMVVPVFFVMGRMDSTVWPEEEEQDRIMRLRSMFSNENPTAGLGSDMVQRRWSVRSEDKEKETIQ